MESHVQNTLNSENTIHQNTSLLGDGSSLIPVRDVGNKDKKPTKTHPGKTGGAEKTSKKDRMEEKKRRKSSKKRNVVVRNNQQATLCRRLQEAGILGSVNIIYNIFGDDDNE